MKKSIKKAMNTGDQILTFIHNELKAAYGEAAEQIYERLVSRLEELREDTDEEFQILLQTFAYPFLTCVDVMKAAGYLEDEAVEFVRAGWNKITPVIFKN